MDNEFTPSRQKLLEIAARNRKRGRPEVAEVFEREADMFRLERIKAHIAFVENKGWHKDGRRARQLLGELTLFYDMGRYVKNRWLSDGRSKGL